MSNIKIFTFEDLEKLVERISKLKNNEHREIIRDIIKKYNPDLSMTENKNGLWMHFDNLNNQTYIDISVFLKKISKSKIIKINNTTASSDSNTMTSAEDHQFNITDSKLKYSNKERNIIKRNLYDKEINGTENDAKEKLNFFNNVNNSKLFIKKSS